MDNLNPSEISKIIKDRINNLEVSSDESNEGTIVFLSDGIARVHGLSEAMYGELIEFQGGIFGMAFSAREKFDDKRLLALTSHHK